MYAYDFEYDGKLLSDYGFVVCKFNSDSLGNADTGSEITFETASAHAGKIRYAVGSEYKDCLTTTFQICKNPKLYADDEMNIMTEEFRELSRWLNRRDFLWFHAFDWCNPEVSRPWVRASFSLTRIDYGMETVGVELKMVTDSPFGYGDPIEKEIVFSSGSMEQTFYDKSDEIGETYPELTIVCKGAGKLTLTDDITGCSFEVENCENGETITLSGDTMMIDTDSAAHKETIANDFNYDFFRFGNTLDNRLNTFTASLPCKVTLRYRPSLKDTI